MMNLLQRHKIVMGFWQDFVQEAAVKKWHWLKHIYNL